MDLEFVEIYSIRQIPQSTLLEGNPCVVPCPLGRLQSSCIAVAMAKQEQQDQSNMADKSYSLTATGGDGISASETK